ncbi:MAG: hypothetical protein SGI84_04050 [Gemmatimonadota bacterium]|nr:hypothetical protein [Gemmatimonadota bacterium]
MILAPPTIPEPDLRASQPTLVAAARAIAASRDSMVNRWADWLGDRITSSKIIPRVVIERELGLLVDTLGGLIGPLRREVRPVWRRVTEHYGRIGAARGLAAGEIVEEMQYLRELLIRHLAPVLAAMRPRQGMALFLRLNSLVDTGVAMAVVGYTDALAATLLTSEDSAPNGMEVDPDEVGRQLEAFEGELGKLALRV